MFIRYSKISFYIILGIHAVNINGTHSILNTPNNVTVQFLFTEYQKMKKLQIETMNIKKELEMNIEQGNKSIAEINKISHLNQSIHMLQTWKGKNEIQLNNLAFVFFQKEELFFTYLECYFNTNKLTVSETLLKEYHTIKNQVPSIYSTENRYTLITQRSTFYQLLESHLQEHFGDWHYLDTENNAT